MGYSETTERKLMEDTNPIGQVVSTIVIMAATFVAAHYIDKALVTGIKKVRPALKVPKLSKVKP
jgi:hypothetical protein